MPTAVGDATAGLNCTDAVFGTHTRTRTLVALLGTWEVAGPTIADRVTGVVPLGCLQ
ncbi:hypothetical protein GCM10010358_46010 [Streptomyces minutiscleroticus]|uniref:Uncharacterized protein n=1 Tax=Streptomyces minutiscleroticus TaxID=68238 RepID=A0A918NQ41_9ACTN|nr:hypothetical protein GCM10010358_46010 [Streptomyces minutiscleroticus]